MDSSIMNLSTQTRCYLLELPREMRDEIFFRLFKATRLSYGKRVFIGKKGASLQTIRPAKNSLSLLRTNHQIYAEASGAWLSRVTFNFATPRALVEKFSSLSHTTLAGIRHVHVSCEKGHFTNGASNGFSPPSEHHQIATFLALFPTLKLDVLTIIYSGTLPGVTNLIEILIRLSTEWKQLRFISEYSNAFGFFESRDKVMTTSRYLDVWDPQPQTWEAVLKERDGVNSGASVVAYQGLDDAHCNPGLSLIPDRRIRVAHKTVDAYADLRSSVNLIFREIMIHATRGAKRPCPVPPYVWDTPRLKQKLNQFMFELLGVNGLEQVLNIYKEPRIEGWTARRREEIFDTYDRVDEIYFNP